MQRAAQLGIEGAEGFVEQEDRGSQDQGPGQGHPLLLATRQLARTALFIAGELDEFEGFPKSCGRLCLGQLEVAQSEGHIVGYREERKEGVVLEDGVDVAFVGRTIGHIDAIEEDGPAGGLLEAGYQPEGRRLSAPGWPEDGEELAARDL